MSYLLIYLLLINTITFLVYGYDKHAARKRSGACVSRRCICWR